jgi:citrate synthase
MPTSTLTVVDNRTGARYELPIADGAIRAGDLAQIRERPDGPGLLSYDPALTNTATCKSRISYLDGRQGILRYRGYSIEDLAEHSSFLETAYLIVKGELPTRSHFAMWEHNIKTHTLTHENVKRFIDRFRYDAHPMGILIGTIGSLSTFYPDAYDIFDIESRRVQTRRLIGKLPTIAAFAYRHRRGLPYVDPDNALGYAGNFLSMLFRMTELRYQPNPVFERALDLLFLLHADQEQTCSATTARIVCSAHADAFSAVAAAAAALSGPRHGAANVKVLEALEQIGTVANVPAVVQEVKGGKRQLPGFGHPVFTTHDPRTPILHRLAHEVIGASGRSPVVDVALELERIAREDDWFVSRHLYPNIDFYSGLIYWAIGIPVVMFPALLAIARTAGWMAQWSEMLTDEEQPRITRPKQIYVGAPERPYVAIDRRQEAGPQEPLVKGRY